ncbi:hypothetical protein LJR296_006761 [Cupriavidus necator]|uniref:hypothetical protein n=1 Tax=Cupriavidus necator TaxID=106590 RepID=UPI003ECD39EE
MSISVVLPAPRCNDGLARVGVEPVGTGKPVDLRPAPQHIVAAIVPGIGYDCFRSWLNAQDTVIANLRQSGNDGTLIDVDALSSSANIARQIRDAVSIEDFR